MVVMQGDSYPVFIELTQGGYVLTPDMVEEVEICVGDTLAFKASAGEVGFDSNLQRWYIRPTQAQTLAMEATDYSVIARVKYTNDPADVKGINCGRIRVNETFSTEVI